MSTANCNVVHQMDQIFARLRFQLNDRFSHSFGNSTVWRFLRGEGASARMELHFILLPRLINRIVFTWNTRLYTRLGEREDEDRDDIRRNYDRERTYGYCQTQLVTIEFACSKQQFVSTGQQCSFFQCDSHRWCVLDVQSDQWNRIETSDTWIWSFNYINIFEWCPTAWVSVSAVDISSLSLSLFFSSPNIVTNTSSTPYAWQR